MATQSEINTHDNLITGLADEMASGLDSLLATALLGLAAIDLTDRVAINNLFTDVRQYIAAQVQGLDTLAVDNLALNNVAADSAINQQVVDLKVASNATMNNAVDQEVNTITGELVAAALLGLGVTQIVRSIIDRVPAIVSRLRRAYDQTLIRFTSVLTKTLGTRYQYVGGIITTTRPFCATHSGNTYTENQINSIWTGSWQGKAPGDPFAVRGGYNCRHFWILET